MRARLLVCCLALGCGASTAPPEPSRAGAAQAPPLPLAEVLYAGELGPQAEALGDRVRILVWLRSLELSPEELESLRQASLRVRAAGAAAAAQREQVGQRELERLVPAYETLARALAAGPVDEAEAAALAAEIRAARDGLEDPRAVRAAGVADALGEAARWSETLDERQRRGMANALFFLRDRVGLDSAPGLYEDLLGTPWQPGDFASLRRSRSGEQGQLDVGGLFTLDGGRQDVTENLDGLKLTALTVIALGHPGLAPAVEVLQGRRDPLDLGP